MIKSGCAHPRRTFLYPCRAVSPEKALKGSVGNVINATKKLSTNAAARDDKVGETVTGRGSGAVGVAKRFVGAPDGEEVIESLKAVILRGRKFSSLRKKAFNPSRGERAFIGTEGLNFAPIYV